VVGAEALERGVQAGEQRAPGRSVAKRAAGQRRPPRDHDVVAGNARREHLGQHFLGGAVAISVGGLDERAACVDERRQLGGRALGVGVLTPGHRAQADSRHLQPASANPTPPGTRSYATIRGPVLSWLLASDALRNGKPLNPATIPRLSFNAAPSYASTDAGVTPAFSLDNGFPTNWPRPPFIFLNFSLSV